MDIEGFNKVLAAYPDLTANGFESEAFVQRREKRTGEPYKKCPLPSFENIQSCVEWLLRHDALERRKTINRRISSYTWKHIVERSLGKYISNGDFICAALYLNYKMWTDRSTVSLNAYFNIRDYKEQ